MSIRARILALVGSFAIMALAVTALGLVTLSDYNRMMERSDRAYLNAWRGEHLNRLVSQVVMEARGLYIANDATETTVFASNLNRNLDEMEVLLADWQKDANSAQVAALRQEATAFIALRRELAQVGAAGDHAGAERLGVANRPTRIAFQSKVEALVQSTHAELTAARTDADRFTQRRAVEFFAASIIGIVIMLSLALWVVSHFVTRPLRDIATAIIHTSRGDYAVPLQETGGKDEISTVWQALAVLKERAIEHERLTQAQREAERQDELKLREILLD
ncbi:HAMP domain protein [Asticcacaulis biprosthecium C19]|uniref:HAMP domain protein n=1 Tax=Asticcacaulis biprosthecium C19 TaxID=715226 RepID=F4QNM1_9CAUL|nr:HAMP domain-containing protein [Asticcacaulis biprosthecium]EGF90929.1 HAMP domain protein [Asticcacaulis biprosthecium C19]